MIAIICFVLSVYRHLSRRALSVMPAEFRNLLGSTLESIIHELLYSRSIYPPDSFMLYRHLGVRCHASRVPQVCDYIANFLMVALPSILSGMGDCITLVILEEETSSDMACDGGLGERTGAINTVERFVFQFQIDDVIGNDSIANIGTGTDSNTTTIEGEKKRPIVVDIEDVQQRHDVIKLDAEIVLEARAHMERSMREVLLRTLALRRRRRRQGEKPENMSFKLCLHVVGGDDDGVNGQMRRDENSCPELMRVLKQGEWLIPEESSCLFSSSSLSPAANGSSSGKGLLRPIKDISLPSCGMRMQFGMEVDPSE